MIFLGWDISPNEIEIDASNSRSTDCRLYLTNNTNKERPFEFIWPAKTLVITPSKDQIPPHGKLGVRIDARHTFLSKHEENSWSGSVYVQCGENQKVSLQVICICYLF